MVQHPPKPPAVGSAFAVRLPDAARATILVCGLECNILASASCLLLSQVQNQLYISLKILHWPFSNPLQRLWRMFLGVHLEPLFRIRAPTLTGVTALQQGLRGSILRESLPSSGRSRALLIFRFVSSCVSGQSLCPSRPSSLGGHLLSEAALLLSLVSFISLSVNFRLFGLLDGVCFLLFLLVRISAWSGVFSPLLFPILFICSKMPVWSSVLEASISSDAVSDSSPGALVLLSCLLISGIREGSDWKGFPSAF